MTKAQRKQAKIGNQVRKLFLMTLNRTSEGNKVHSRATFCQDGKYTKFVKENLTPKEPLVLAESE